VYLECLRAYILIAFRGPRTVEGGKRLDTPVGTVLAGRYKVESTLGSGGMAVVYRAEDDILGRAVALKTLHHHFAEMPSFRRRFRQEARAMASLDHENIVKVYDISQDGEVPFIVVECVSGRDLGDLLGDSRRRSGRLNEQSVRRMAIQLLHALSYAHGRGIIHRDIKPSNILLTSEGTVKVADFGIARIVEEDDAGDAGEIVGSARYMSPEQLRGEAATPRSDVYSVGVLLYHCLTGRPPFSGDVKSLASQHIHKDPTPPRRLNKRITPEMEAVIMKALSKKPRDRYFSADAMLDDIERESLPRPAGTAAAPRPARHKARGGALVLASVVILLLLLGGGGALASGLVGLPQGGSVADTLSRMNPVETEPPAPPQGAQGDGTAGDTMDEPSGRSGSQNVASVTEAASSQARTPARPKMVPVPNVTAYYDYYAEDALINRGFDVRFVYDYQDGFAPRGVTWATDPAAGTLAPRGSTVTVYATPKDLPLPRRLR
jgi:eukaryotic-like serine/threonine-protein kinase